MADNEVSFGEGDFGKELFFVGAGSWGEVWGIKDEQERRQILTKNPQIAESQILGVAIKKPKENSVFVQRGAAARLCLEEEVACGLRQGKVGISPVIRMEKETNNQLLIWFKEVDRQEIDDKEFFMNNLMARIKTMFEPRNDDSVLEMAKVVGVRELVLDSRMAGYKDDEYLYSVQAKLVWKELERKLIGDDWEDLLKKRFENGKFGSQHGDPRLDNVIPVLRKDGRHEAVILDAVRLVLDDGKEGKIMKKWWHTDVMMQAGMALGKLFALDEQNWFKEGIGAYQRVFEEDIERDESLLVLFGLSLIYGMSVDVHVLEARLAEIDRLTEEDKNTKLLAEAWEIDCSIANLWVAMSKLAVDLGSWR